jgi:hypothetical protein
MFIISSITNEFTEYYEIFDIRLHHVLAHSATGVFEPEAQIFITTVTVHNTSTMPTPRRMFVIHSIIWLISIILHSNLNQ